jgi:hypothetical protein
MSYADNKVKVTVIESHCPKYKVGDVICFEGSCLDKERSDNVCMVAMNALYPFIYAFRRAQPAERSVSVHRLRGNRCVYRRDHSLTGERGAYDHS